MSPDQLRKLVAQMKLCHTINRMHSMPFFFNFTNLQMDGPLHSMLLKDIPTLHSKTFPIRVTEQFISDDIAKERLVYLTPNSPNRLTEFNDRDVFIIGALVDNVWKESITMAKAERFGLRTARLPLEQFVQWAGSSRALTIDQMTKILLKFKKSGDIKQTLEHVPSRKIHKETY